MEGYKKFDEECNKCLDSGERHNGYFSYPCDCEAAMKKSGLPAVGTLMYMQTYRLECRSCEKYMGDAFEEPGALECQACYEKRQAKRQENI